MVRLSPREKIETALARAMLSLPLPVVRALAGRTVEVDGRALDPQVQLVLRAAKLAGKRAAHEQSVPDARRDLDVSGNQVHGLRNTVMNAVISASLNTPLPILIITSFAC